MTQKLTSVINGDAVQVIGTLKDSVTNPVIVTDPPFNIGKRYASFGDRLKKDEYFGRLIAVLTALDCPFVVIHYPEALHELSIRLGRPPERVVSWVYPSNTRRQHRDIAFYGITPDFKRVTQPYKNPTDKRVRDRIAKGFGCPSYDWFEINQVKNVSREKAAHPCQMPVDVMRRVVGVLHPPITVIDPYCGTGTTGVACQALGVPFIGIEIDPGYCGIAEERLGMRSNDF